MAWADGGPELLTHGRPARWTTAGGKGCNRLILLELLYLLGQKVELEPKN